MTVDGTKVPLKYVCAVEKDDAEGLRNQGVPQKTLALQFTDAPLPPNAIGEWSQCSDLARAGKLKVVELDLDPKQKALLTVLVFYPPLPGETPLTSIYPSARSDVYQLDGLRIAGGRVSGAVRMSKSEPFLHSKPGLKPEKFQFELKFDAPIRPAPKVTEILEGPRVAKTPQMRAVLAFERAVRKGDAQAARSLLSVEAKIRWDEIVANAGAKKAMAEIRNRSFPVRRVIERMIARGDRISIVYRDEGDRGVRKLVRENYEVKSRLGERARSSRACNAGAPSRGRQTSHPGKELQKRRGVAV